MVQKEQVVADLSAWCIRCKQRHHLNNFAMIQYELGKGWIGYCHQKPSTEPPRYIKPKDSLF